ncbi:hypothetical protein D9M68_755910 [compost metagenome]
MAGVIRHQWIDANDDLAGQMPIQHLVAQRYQLTMRTLAAFDPGFLANADSPLVGTGRGIPRFARLAFPAQRKHIGSALEQAPEQLQLRIGAQHHRRWFG